MVEVARRGLAEDVAGLVYRRDGDLVHTPFRAPRQDLASFHPLPYDLFDMAHYTAPDRGLIRWLKLRAINLRTSRGCPNRCRFCAGHLVAGLGGRYHSVDFVMDQIRHVVGKYGVQAIRFEDDEDERPESVAPTIQAGTPVPILD